jgi:hypothetical protein
MTETARQQWLADRATNLSVTLNQFILMCQMASDATEYSEENLQSLVFNKLESGCELVLGSIGAMYRIQLMRRKQRCRLKCVMEQYGRRSIVIHESSDHVRGFEILRAKVLLMEGYEINSPQKGFDTCQKENNAEVNV